ncbi:MAG: SDR family oxidoreductase [Actinomycetota bacterium]|nr:SDR family oxidoreductase [Actinomycetota bacterium]
MEFKGKNIVVTGGASGIGEALVHRAKQEEPAQIVVADRDGTKARAVAGAVGGLGVEADLGTEAGVLKLIAEAEKFGPIDIFCSNAGITGPHGGPEASDEEWRTTMDINVMAHVWAARELLPKMIERGEGHLNSTASAAGLLCGMGTMAYTVSKAAAVGVAEYLAVTYGGRGVSFSCFCPQAVSTPMLAVVADDPMTMSVNRAGDTITPAEAGDAIVNGIKDGKFLILSHPEVRTYRQRKVDDPERWIAGMQRVQAKIDAAEAAARK